MFKENIKYYSNNKKNIFEIKNLLIIAEFVYLFQTFTFSSKTIRHYDVTCCSGIKYLLNHIIISYTKEKSRIHSTYWSLVLVAAKKNRSNQD